MQFPLIVSYVLTSNGKDIYADMNLISVWSLKQSNPNAKVIILCDQQTHNDLEEAKHQIIQVVDEVISISVPSQPPSFRNRYLKTSIRKYIKGTFLYLDADILVRDDITPIFKTQVFIAGVPNHNGTGSPSEIPGTETKIFEQIGWPLPSDYYVNGGVLFFADHPDVYAFCELWHQKWQECSTTTGQHYDQPSLNTAISESKIKFDWLDHRYNAQVHARPHTAWGAAIWHIYLSGHHASPKTVLDQALGKLKSKCLTSSVEVAKFCQRDHPWVINNPLDWLAIASLKKGQGILNGDRWERLWLADEYGLLLKKLRPRFSIRLYFSHRLTFVKRVLKFFT